MVNYRLSSGDRFEQEGCVSYEVSAARVPLARISCFLERSRIPFDGTSSWPRLSQPVASPAKTCTAWTPPMLLTITTTHQPATDLGYLLHKNPARVQAFDLSFGRAHVFYPQASPRPLHGGAVAGCRSRAARSRPQSRGERFSTRSVRQRPALRRQLALERGHLAGLGTALAGRCRDKPELAELRLPLVARLAALRCRGGEALLRQLFEPLGYAVEAARAAAG